MNNVIDIAQQLIQNDHFKMLLKDYLSHIYEDIKQKDSKQRQEPGYTTMKSIIDQINDSLLVLTNTTAIQQKTEFYISLMKRNQQIFLEQQIKVQLMLKQKIKQIKTELIEEIKKLFQLENVFQKNSKKSIIYQQKSILGKSLLNCYSPINSKFNISQKNVALKSSFIKKNETIIKNENDTSLDNILNEHEQYNFNQINYKINEFQNSQRKLKKDVYQIMNQRLNQHQNDIKKIMQKIVDVRLKIDQKIQAGFSGIWNVLSNIQQKLLNLSHVVAQLS